MVHWLNKPGVSGTKDHRSQIRSVSERQGSGRLLDRKRLSVWGVSSWFCHVEMQAHYSQMDFQEELEIHIFR